MAIVYLVTSKFCGGQINFSYCIIHHVVSYLLMLVDYNCKESSKDYSLVYKQTTNVKVWVAPAMMPELNCSHV